VASAGLLPLAWFGMTIVQEWANDKALLVTSTLPLSVSASLALLGVHLEVGETCLSPALPCS